MPCGQNGSSVFCLIDPKSVTTRVHHPRSRWVFSNSFWGNSPTFNRDFLKKHFHREPTDHMGVYIFFGTDNIVTTYLSFKLTGHSFQR